MRRKLNPVLSSYLAQAAPTWATNSIGSGSGFMAQTVDGVWASVLLSPTLRIAAFLWGALWGSFANVVIHRIPLGESPIHPRSRCGNCRTLIAWYDNIPLISYFVLGGKCRHCKQRFGLRYVFVELMAAVLSFVTYMQYVAIPLLAGQDVTFGSLVMSQLAFVIAVVLVIVTYIDIDYWIIPPQIVVPFGLLGIALAWWDPTFFDVPGLQATVASLAGAGVVVAIRWIYLKWRGIEAMGLGDASLLFMIGGLFGLRGLMWSLSAGAIQALLVAVPLKLMGKRVATHEIHEVHGNDPVLGPNQSQVGVMATMVPFGPFLALAALELLFFGDMLSVTLRGFGW